MQRRTGNGYIRKIDYVFYNEKEIRAAVAEARGDAGGHGKNGSGIADPTASAAIRNASPLLSVTVGGDPLGWPEHWLAVVDAVYAWCDRDRLIVARDRYSGVDYRQTCAKLNISQSTYSDYLRDVRHYAALCAVQRGLVKVF